MRVLLATHFFPPGQAGGTESYTLGLARKLRSLGHEASVICAGDLDAAPGWPPRTEDDEYDGIPVRRLSWNWVRAPHPFKTFYDNREAERLVREYIGQFRPDVIHVTSCYSLGAGILRAARTADVTTILTLTDFWFLCVRHTLLRADGTLCSGPVSAVDCQRCMAGGSPVLRPLLRALSPNLAARGLLAAARWASMVRLPGLRGYVGNADERFRVVRRAFEHADAVIAPSRFLRDTFIRNGFPADRIRVSPYGIDLSWRPDDAPRRPDGVLALGYLGQIEPIKGVDILVRAVRTLDPTVRVRLSIYGPLDKNPAYAESVRTLAGDDERIHFPGAYGRGDLCQILARLDAVVVPSIWYENTPLVIAEAHAARRPVLATHLGGMAEAVTHEIDGLLFKRGDATDLARLIRQLAEEPGLLDRLREGIRPVRTIDDEVIELLALYRGTRSLARA
ncbi:MAG: glycosyltransferase family 4 protein [Chloroflexi bacterium]|nr:glycosyltransferase family 4 protein [Chloroflexota bacterium]